MKITFPFNGLHTGAPLEEQPPTTSPSLSNVRPIDVDDERVRGGQRPGLIKAYTTQVGGDHPVVNMTQITTTYIEAS